jgi:hypothetical protein
VSRAACSPTSASFEQSSSVREAIGHDPAARALIKVVGTHAALDLAAAMAGAEVVEADEVVGCNSLTIGRSTSKTEPWLQSSVKKYGPSSRQP